MKDGQQGTNSVITLFFTSSFMALRFVVLGQSIAGMRASVGRWRWDFCVYGAEHKVVVDLNSLPVLSHDTNWQKEVL